MPKSNSNSTTKKSRMPLYISFLLIVGILICFFTVPSFNQFLKEAWDVLSSDDETRIKSWVEGFTWFGPVLIILLMIVQMFLLIIPSILLMIVSVLAYGPVWGSIISLISVGIASTLGYGIGRQLGVNPVQRILGEKTLQKIESFVNDYGFWAVAITRINPFLSNDAISFVTGMIKMDYWKFISSSFLGIGPLILFLAITGEDTDSLKSGLLWGSIVCFLIYGGYVWWDKRRKSSRDKYDSGKC
jgi:uncharacterized membrane protein YdjX (TVP38/TMEM64 family)